MPPLPHASPARRAFAPFERLHTRRLLALSAGAALLWGCSTQYESDLADGTPAGGRGGATGGGGRAGSAPVAGRAGTAGSGGAAGITGNAGGAGSAGGPIAAGSAGMAGMAGTAGQAGGAGAAGQALAGAAGASGMAGASGGSAGRLPERPLGQALEGGGSTVTFLARRTFFGTRTESLQPESSAWRRYGLDWDARSTSQGAGGTAMGAACKRPPSSNGSPFSTLGTPGFFDGDDGRDNAFGGTIIPLLSFLQTNPEVSTDAATESGGPTLVLRIADLADGPDDTYAPGELFFTKAGDVSGAMFDASPPQVRTVDASSAAYVTKGADGQRTVDWPADGMLPALAPGESYVGMTARLRFPKAYVRNHRWISGDLVGSEGGALLPAAGGMLRFPTLASVLTVDLTLDHRKPDGGRAAFVVTPQSLNEAIGAPTSPLLKCGSGGSIPAATFGSLLAEAADLKAGAADFVDEAVACDAISVSVGLQLVPTQIASLPAGLDPYHYECGDGSFPVRVKNP